MKDLCESNGDNCKTCSEQNCNTRTVFESCFHCNSSVNPLCLSLPDYVHPKVCTKYDDVCFTHISKYGIERGCLDEYDISVKTDCKQKRKCATCTTKKYGGGCNSDNVIMENCVECDSDNGDDCQNMPELYENKVCSEFTYYTYQSEREGCYLLQVRICYE